MRRRAVVGGGVAAAISGALSRVWLSWGLAAGVMCSAALGLALGLMLRAIWRSPRG